MKRQYKTVLNDVAIKRDVIGEKPNAGYKLFERKRGIPLASPVKTARSSALRFWSIS
jgi:hypothetical protein